MGARPGARGEVMGQKGRGPGRGQPARVVLRSVGCGAGASGLSLSQPLTLSLLMASRQVPHLENGIIVSEFVLQQMLDNS